ncbi:MAG: hypothetical protein K0S98_1427, partial [Propionibacteriaceae bacterium]|nr:hypothetical protein [Propionibacteriaceae bacterium]
RAIVAVFRSFTEPGLAVLAYAGLVVG